MASTRSPSPASSSSEDSSISSSSSINSSIHSYQSSSGEPHLLEPTEARPDLRIQIISDLHIECYDKWKILNFLIEPQAPILALLDDIGHACSHQLRTFLHSQCDRFEHVLFLAGNHEYYNKGDTVNSMTEQNEWMISVCSERPNLHFMEKESLVLNGITILGTTLWSEIPDDSLELAERDLNDYHLSYNHAAGEAPRGLKAIETRALHRENIRWLESELRRATYDHKALVVLTHHTPMVTGTSHPRFENSDITCCFSSDLEELLLESSPALVAWACGHTHYNFDFMVGDVRVLSDQRGYKYSRNSEYEENGVVLEVNQS